MNNGFNVHTRKKDPIRLVYLAIWKIGNYFVFFPLAECSTNLWNVKFMSFCDSRIDLKCGRFFPLPTLLDTCFNVIGNFKYLPVIDDKSMAFSRIIITNVDKQSISNFNKKLISEDVIAITTISSFPGHNLWMKIQPVNTFVRFGTCKYSIS